jgi:hypothetical protein
MEPVGKARAHHFAVEDLTEECCVQTGNLEDQACRSAKVMASSFVVRSKFHGRKGKRYATRGSLHFWS